MDSYYLPGIAVLQLPKQKEEFINLLDIRDHSESLPAKHLADLVLANEYDGPPISTVVVESDYVDRYESVAYARAYARSFRYFERNCIRMHLFSSEVSEGMLISRSTTKDLQRSYRGFCVLRRVPRDRALGRMVVSPLGAISSDTFPFRTGFKVNLVGHALEAFGAPFYQRDRRVAACATSAVWMALSLMSSSLRTHPDPSPTEISDVALGIQLGLDGRPVNGMGLTAREIVRAITKLGFNCANYEARRGARIGDLLSKYLDSGIAPILHVGLRSPQVGHAIVATGLRSAAASEFMPSRHRLYMQSSELVTAFFVHDDRLGAYLEMKLTEREGKRFARLPITISWCTRSLTQDECQRESDKYSGISLTGITVPLPPRVSLVAEKAEEKAWSIVERAIESFDVQGLPSQSVLRTYLVSSNDFKERLNPELDNRLAGLYRGTHMPRYVWVTEVRHFVKATALDDSELYGIMIVDSTSEPDSEDFVALHMVGRYARMLPGETDSAAALHKSISVPNEKEFADSLLVFQGKGGSSPFAMR